MNDSKLLEMVQVFETECEKLTSKDGKNEKRLKPFAHQVITFVPKLKIKNYKATKE